MKQKKRIYNPPKAATKSVQEDEPCRGYVDSDTE
jgi:hypothetical protein